MDGGIGDGASMGLGQAGALNDLPDEHCGGAHGAGQRGGGARLGQVLDGRVGTEEEHDGVQLTLHEEATHLVHVDTTEGSLRETRRNRGITVGWRIFLFSHLRTKLLHGEKEFAHPSLTMRSTLGVPLNCFF